MLNTSQFFKCLADDTRLLSVLLIHQLGELCVCELTEALADHQPKVSRHLAQLRSAGLLSDRRDRQWVYYSLAATLPDWAIAALNAALLAEADTLVHCQQRLQAMSSRPQRCC